MRTWNTTREEAEARFPCDAYLDEPFARLTRAIDIDAPPPVVFRWLCQMKVAPYSYDWLDNWGRRSPRTLTPGTDELAPGQQFGPFRVVDFERDAHLSGIVLDRYRPLFGPVAATYRVTRRGERGTRLVVRLDAAARSLPGRVRRELLGWGDLVMMRKQLMTFRELAESAGHA